MDSSNVNDNDNVVIDKPVDKNTEMMAWSLLNDEGVESKTIEGLLSDEDYTDDWSIGRIQDKIFQSAYFWISVLDAIDKNPQMTYKYNLQTCIENVHLFCPNLSVFVRKIKNLKEKIQKKNQMELLQNFVIERKQVENIGEELKAQGITESWLNDPSGIEVDFVSIKLILELRKYKKINNITDKKCALWIQHLCKLPYLPHLGKLWVNIDRLFKKRNKMRPEDRKDFLNSQYKPPTQSADHNTPNKMKCPNCCKGCTSSTKKPKENANNSSGINMHEYRKLKKEKYDALFNLYKLNEENTNLNGQLNTCKQKLGTLSARNVNKKIKRRNDKIQSLLIENEKLLSHRKHLQSVIQNIRQKYKQKTSLLKYHNRKSKKFITKKEVTKVDTKEQSKYIENENSKLKEQIHYLENENIEIKEQIEELMKVKEINTFANGKYNDNVREVYAALLSSNVGVKNVEQIIRTVLNKLGGVNVGRLPKKTFAEVMLVEAKALAQIQSVDAIINSSDSCTIHTDGTKRKGHEYGGLQISTSSGQYSLGISELAEGTAVSFLCMIKNIFANLAELTDDNPDKKCAKILSSIKNMMTDRHIVNSSLKKSIEKWKLECLPLVIENFNDFSEEAKKALTDINHFKCNLHVLVNLGTQAEAALKEWTKAVVISDTLPSDVFSASTPDFIRSVTKLCVPGADQKSGYGLLFNSYLQSLEPPITPKISTFYGHRINILFSMAASVYYHAVHIKEFTELYFNEKQNNLVSCVSHYINNKIYLAGCRALGIVDKLCTGPLWRQIESSKHILDLNDMWLNFYNLLDEFSKDASELIKGKIIYPDYTVQDDVYDCLFAECDEEIDTLTIEALQILCTNFLIIIKRQLSDYLPGGKFNIDTAENFEQLVSNSSTVSSTNIISERDFANLDRLRREKPNANTIAIEGMILFSNNKTLNWLDSLDPEKKTNVIKMARETAPTMIKNYRQQKHLIKQKHIELLNKRKEENLRLQNKKIEDTQKTKQDIKKYGGEWKNEHDIATCLKKVPCASKLDALKAQLRFQRIVLRKNPADKTLFHFSHQGKSHDIEKLTENLSKLLQISQTEFNKDQQTPNVHKELVMKTKADRELFMEQQRTGILEKIQKLKRKAMNIDTVTEIEENYEPKQKRTKPYKEIIFDFVEQEEIDITTYKFILGDMVAIAYNDIWYPGLVQEVVNDEFAFLKCLHPTNTKQTAFRWPNKDDIIKVENIFIFESGFDIVPNDSSCRSFSIPQLESINNKYNIYREKYF